MDKFAFIRSAVGAQLVAEYGADEFQRKQGEDEAERAFKATAILVAALCLTLSSTVPAGWG